MFIITDTTTNKSAELSNSEVLYLWQHSDNTQLDSILDVKIILNPEAEDLLYYVIRAMNKTDHFSNKSQLVDEITNQDKLGIDGIAIYDVSTDWRDSQVVEILLSGYSAYPKIDFEYLWQYAKDNFLPNDYDTFISCLLNWNILVYSL